VAGCHPGQQQSIGLLHFDFQIWRSAKKKTHPFGQADIGGLLARFAANLSRWDKL